MSDSNKLSSTHPFLRSKIQIGNVQGPLNFHSTQHVFHHDDVPEVARQRTAQVKEWKRSKILDTSRHPWNKSTDPNIPICIRKKMENHIHDRSHSYQYNYRAETLDSLRMIEPIDQSTKFHISKQLQSKADHILTIREGDPIQRGRLHRTAEMPIHPELAEATPWNYSTVVTVQDIDNGLMKKTTHAKEWTSKVSTTLSQKKEYIPPMKSVQLFQEKIRAMKREGTFASEVVFNRPKSDPVDRKSLRNRHMVGKLNLITTTSHSGVWGPGPDNGRMMWSDTGSYEQDARGDVIKVTNLDQQNYASPVKGSRRLLPSSSPNSRDTERGPRPNSRGGRKEPQIRLEDSFSSGNLSQMGSQVN